MTNVWVIVVVCAARVFPVTGGVSLLIRDDVEQYTTAYSDGVAPRDGATGTGTGTDTDTDTRTDTGTGTDTYTGTGTGTATDTGTGTGTDTDTDAGARVAASSTVVAAPGNATHYAFITAKNTAGNKSGNAFKMGGFLISLGGQAPHVPRAHVVHTCGGPFLVESGRPFVCPRVILPHLSLFPGWRSLLRDLA